ncbi:hypothetical protein Egran_03983 [Elaphomyces granulatus]|uniref:Non-structural maintenance of chromosomes element 4 n=1 Tax=Elaphomyces granulatus TaxID=519963 RepID=A0A232LW07_9EURO|nr:hypothetical protein Egran_03983 [Elaphomyces granulatus]
MAHATRGSLQEETSSSLDNSLSDKENQALPRDTSRSDKRKNRGETMASSNAHRPASGSSATKRRRLAEGSSNLGRQSQDLRSQQPSDKDFYDPDQDENERRRIRKELRVLTQELRDCRAEYLQAGNRGIVDTLQRANEIFVHVKQTSDATVDSRLLVNAADLSYKKSAQLVLGDATAGIDVDEFVSKCILFMRRGPEDVTSAIGGTQRRRQRAQARSHRDDEESGDDEEGDALNWDWLGRAACLPHNIRPSVSGFLLGPLSVQKRTRQQTQRRARERIDPSQVVQPQELQEEDLDKQETSNLTVLCTNINKLLLKTQLAAQALVNKELGPLGEDVNLEILQEVMNKHNIADDGGVPLFRFCINPRSFGQSVENLFYVSFLVRDGSVGVSTDSRGLPTLLAAKPYAPNEAQKKGIQKHQAVFSLDFKTWRELVDTFGITESVIPHRQEEEQIRNERRRGWYG